MSNQQGIPIPMPEAFGQFQTLFYVEGKPTAILVKSLHGRRRERVLKLATAQAALAWCQARRAMLVYLPANPQEN